MEESLKKLLLETAPIHKWHELCAIFLYDDDAAKLTNYYRDTESDWKSYDAGDFELLDWLDEYMEQDPEIKSIKAILNERGDLKINCGYEIHEIFTNNNGYELIEKLS